MKRYPIHIVIHDDEIPYSFITRYALLCGLTYKGIAKQQIFNNAKKRIHPFLPGQLNAVAEFFDLNLHQMIMQQTLFPLFKYANPLGANELYRKLSFETEAKTTMGNAMLKTFYGVKFCPECVSEDISSLGYPYWHVDHQVPGIEACYKHFCLLQGVSTGEMGKDRQLLLPPDDFRPIKALNIQVTFAKFTHDFLILSRQHNVNYSVSYNVALSERNLVTAYQHLRLRGLLQQIQAYWDELPFNSTYGVHQSLETYKFIGPLLRTKTHFPCHPIKHLLLSCWLFDGEATKLFPPKAKQSRKQKAEENNKNENHDEIIIAMLKNGQSMNLIQTKTGRSRCYIRRVAELNSLFHLTNAQAYSDEMKRTVQIKALLGFHRQDIATSLDVGIGYVEQVISNTPHLVEWRKHLRKAAKYHCASITLKQAKALHPEWIRKDFKSQYNAEFFYLYNHDKAQLEDILPPKTSPSIPKRDWEQIDHTLTLKIRSIKLVNTMSLTKIEHHINARGYLLHRLSKLPITKALLLKLGVIKD